MLTEAKRRAIIGTEIWWNGGKNYGSKDSSYRIVASDSRVKRDGEYLELIGRYNPILNETEINEELAMKWLRTGAIPTDTVRNLFSKAGIMKKFAEEKQGK